MKIVTLLLASSFIIASCNNKTTKAKEKENTPVTDTTKNQMVGNDRDEHGCIGSAGYQWSAVLNNCIRIFEAGTRLSAAAAVSDKTVDAFAILSADNTKAEIYVPKLSGSGIILTQTKNNSKTWVKDEWLLEKTTKGLQLKKAGIVQYEE